jgi:hypothetical protein
MFKKLRGLFSKVTSLTKKETYMQQLEFFDNEALKAEALPTLILNFMRSVDITAITALTPRDLMGIRVETRHATFGAIATLLEEANNAIANAADDTIIRLCKEAFHDRKDMYLDEYFVVDGLPIEPKRAIAKLQVLLSVQDTLLKAQETTYYARQLNRVYYDLLVLLRTLVEHMGERHDVTT